MPPRGAAVAIAICLIAACGAFFLVWVGDGGNQRPTEGDSVDDDIDRLADRVGSVETRSSTVKGFLADLSTLEADDQSMVAIEIEADKGLVDLAEDVLGAYRRAGAVSLEMSGYMDLKGNAWGAVLRGSDGWVDVVAVFDGDDGLARARVVRMGA